MIQAVERDEDRLEGRALLKFAHLIGQRKGRCRFRSQWEDERRRCRDSLGDRDGDR